MVCLDSLFRTLWDKHGYGLRLKCDNGLIPMDKREAYMVVKCISKGNEKMKPHEFQVFWDLRVSASITL